MRTPRRSIMQLLKGLSANPSADAGKPLFEAMEPRMLLSTSPIDFDHYAVSPYGAEQANTGSAVIENGGATLRLKGNVWKKIDVNYNVTANTVLEFDFAGTTEGEVQGIGFDNDTTAGTGNAGSFMLWGTQLWGNTAFNDYASGQGVKHYKINVGQYVPAGLQKYLAFFSDHDVKNANANSAFSNIKLYEASSTQPGPQPDPQPQPEPDPVAAPAGAINFNQTPITAYGTGQANTGTAVVENGGATVHVRGNAWKKIAVNYNITANTILEFDFRGTREGEVQGIGFDRDTVASPTTDGFKLWGTDAWGYAAYDNYDAAQGTKHYKIEVGKFYRGVYDFLTFISDHDVSSPNAEMFFSNVKIYEGTPDTTPLPPAPTPDLETGSIDLNQFPVSGYAPEQAHNGTGVVENGGATLHLKGNAWKKIAVNYNITANTILEFDFRGTKEGEVQGIGFDNDLTNSANTSFKLWGTDAYGNATFDNYDASQGVKRYKINVGQYLSAGLQKYLTFISDHDIAFPDAEAFFSNIKLYESGSTPTSPPATPTNPAPPPQPDPADPVDAPDHINFNGRTFTDYALAEQGPGVTPRVLDGGRTIHIQGNGWKQIHFPYTITKDTVLEFDFQVNTVGEIHGIGFDNDQTTSIDKGFRLQGESLWAGTEYLGHYGNVMGEWRHYVIPVGQYFTGDVNTLYFVSDDDAGLGADSSFSNVRVFENPSVAPEGQQPLDLREYQALAYMSRYRGALGSATVSNDGSTIAVKGYRKIAVPYSLTKNTIIEFDYRGSGPTEVAGFVFEDDDHVNSEQTFQIAGTTTWFDSIQSFHNYNTPGQWKHYKINVGQFVTGDKTALAFIQDDLARNWADPQGLSEFANIKIYEGPNQALGTVTVGSNSELRNALRNAGPGTTILIKGGNYSGGLYAENLTGTAEKPIVIKAADPRNRPVFSGGSDTLKLSDATYVTLKDLVFQGGSGNGLNIDDGGDKLSPSHHITLENITVQNLGGGSNVDGIKMSGVQHFVLRNVVVKNWGGSLSSGIDMVGCAYGLIENSTFSYTSTGGHTGIQAKGGSHDIVIRNNRFNNAGQRAIQTGGMTDIGAFRPSMASAEARDITIEGNIFVGSETPIAFVNSEDITVRYNTIYNPTKYLFRALDEDWRWGMTETRTTTFTDNLIVHTGKGINKASSAQVDTFTFARNFWYNSANPSASKPNLGAPETNSVYGVNPQFVNAAGGDFHLKAGSPAARYGAYATR